ncbi:MAG: hypothetical protein DCC71_00700 [Proteobacteria bacterium]|nr:MAG: hypothetical protein DCC71_00700 [Pseudomonadota bacterium]
MKRQRTRRAAQRAAHALLLLAFAAAGADAADSGVEPVRACMEKNLPATSAKQEIVLESSDASGSQKLEAELFWRRAAEKNGRQQVLVRVEQPADLRGSAFLLLEREGGYDLFSYLPELQKVRRLTGRAISGSLFGTDFSYEDFERVQSGVAGSGAERLPDADVAGRPVWVVAVTPPADAGSAYQRVVSFVDRETCVALRIDFESEPGRLAKQLLADPAEVRAVAGRYVPHALVLSDAGQDTRTTLAVRKVDFDVPLSPSLFSEAALAKGH